jgi:hypothetical protein
MDQLLAMVVAQVTGRASLRETVLCLKALGPRCIFKSAFTVSIVDARSW